MVLRAGTVGRRVFIGALLALSLPGRAETPARFHEDAAAVQTAALEVSGALYIDDTAAARTALDRLERLCRTRQPEEKSVFGEAIITADLAYHQALLRAREFSGAGNGQLSFEAFIAVQLACRSCHGSARSGGRWPASGSPTGGAAPNRP